MRKRGIKKIDGGRGVMDVVLVVYSSTLTSHSRLIFYFPTRSRRPRCFQIGSTHGTTVRPQHINSSMLLPVPPSPPLIGSPSSVSLPQLLPVSHAWPTLSLFSSTTLLPSSPTFPLPTHSRPPTSRMAGTRASPPRPAQHFPASRVTGQAFMSRLAMALRSLFNGGVRGR